MRRSSLRSLAKINLSLRVLDKRPDGYHELRTVFQTISLADRIDIEFKPGRKTGITLRDSPDIPNNLVVRAAEALYEKAGVRGETTIGLTKQIPMGAGLGGGSANAATVLLGLPVLAGVRLPFEELVEVGASLGSDVPFFLYGGTALGIGRGTELYPIPDAGAQHGIVVAPSVHVSTPEAYRALGRGLTTNGSDSDTSEFQGFVWGLGAERRAGQWHAFCVNDFEAAVFAKHPELRNIRDRLRRAGARPAMMSGSGSALYGLFESREKADRAALAWARSPEVRCYPISLVSRSRYRSLWLRQLADHVAGKQWPPQSRY